MRGGHARSKTTSHLRGQE